MKIQLNNRTEEFDAEELTINDIIKIKNFSFKMLVTKINGNLVKRHERDTSIVRDGDDVHIIHMISGG